MTVQTPATAAATAVICEDQLTEFERALYDTLVVPYYEAEASKKINVRSWLGDKFAHLALEDSTCVSSRYTSDSIIFHLLVLCEKLQTTKLRDFLLDWIVSLPSTTNVFPRGSEDAQSGTRAQMSGSSMLLSILPPQGMCSIHPDNDSLPTVDVIDLHA